MNVLIFCFEFAAEVRGLVNRTTVQEGYEQVQQALLDYCVTCYPQVQVCAEPFRPFCCLSSLLCPLNSLDFQKLSHISLVALLGKVKICMVGFGLHLEFPVLLSASLLLVTKCMYRGDFDSLHVHLNKWPRNCRKNPKLLLSKFLSHSLIYT